MNLKPGNLVLVKADAWKGKRKIKYKRDEETWEVSRQIATDVPSYKVTNQCGQSQVLHQNQLLLIASEVAIPLCMGNCHAWHSCTSPTPCKTTSFRGDEERMPQEKMARHSPDDLSVKLPWGGKIGSGSLNHGCLPECPLKMGEDHR